MTHDGQPVPVTRHGMKRAKQGVLVSASFERTVETFVEAAVHGVKDSCGGVTESIVMNRLAKIGTGFITLVENKKQAEPPPPPAFIGRRRRRLGSNVELPPVFQPTWQFNTDPEHLFRICVLSENKQPFTPPPTTTAAWGDEVLEPDEDAAWGDELDDPEDPTFESSPPCSPPPPPSPPVTEPEPHEGAQPNGTTAPTRSLWKVTLASPRVVRVSETNPEQTIVPWVVRPLSPTLA